MHYCKFGNFREDFIFAKLRIKLKPSQNGKITLSFIDIGKACLSHEFLHVTNMSSNAILQYSFTFKSLSKARSCILT